MKIGILGGTFDPIHQGHLALGRAAQNQFLLDRIFFVPALIPPHKTTRRDMTPAPYRYRMVELAVTGEPGFEVSDIEFSRPEISYTVDTLHALRVKFPQDTFFLILGEDSLAEMPAWKEPEEIKRQAVLLIAKRSNGACDALPPGVFWVNMPPNPVSSSAIREKIRNGNSPGVSMLPENVESYIREMKLYGLDKAPRMNPD